MKRVSSYDRGAPRPKIGSYWQWSKGKGDRTRIIEVKWNGEEWWVRTEKLDPDNGSIASPWTTPRWNDLTVFWEQVVPWTPPWEREQP